MTTMLKTRTVADGPAKAGPARRGLSDFACKQMMAVTGIVFGLYVLFHLLGNLKAYLDPDEFDSYAVWLRHILEPVAPYSSVLWVIRVVLRGCLVGHVSCATIPFFRASAARGPFRRKGLPLKSFAARTMPVTGVILLLFIIFHILDLTTGTRPAAYPVVRDLIVDRSALERVIEAGGFVSVDAGTPPDADTIQIPHDVAETALDFAACIGCGACVAGCPNGSANLFTGAKLAHLSLLPHGQQEREHRAQSMGAQADAEFGHCTLFGECAQVCPAEIPITAVAALTHERLRGWLTRNKMPDNAKRLTRPLTTEPSNADRQVDKVVQEADAR